jgi:hypothetical protein
MHPIGTFGDRRKDEVKPQPWLAAMAGGCLMWIEPKRLRLEAIKLIFARLNQ